LLTVRCACGWLTSGTDDAVVEATMAHGLRLHNMAATRQQILAMAIPAHDSGGRKDGQGAQERPTGER
jgi:hypothetical protein